MVETLESGQFDQLGASVFVRGHLRRYGELLGENGDALVAQWAQLDPVRQAMPDLTRVPQAPRPPDTARIWRLTALASGVAVFGIVTWWVLQRPAPPGVDTAMVTVPPPAPQPAAIETRLESVAAAPSPPEAMSVALPVAAVAPVATLASGAAPASSTASKPAPKAVQKTVASNVPGSATAGTSPTITTMAVAANSSAKVLISLSEECWVEVHDFTDKRLYTGLAPAGRRIALAGAAPLRVLLGRDGAARLEVNGRPVTPPKAVRPGQTSLFTVTADGTTALVRRD
jgi:cytoskeleton protein RodZ